VTVLDIKPDTMNCAPILSLIGTLLILLVTSPANSAWLGVEFRSHTQESDGLEGILVVRVLPNGPAEQAGLQPGDLILTVNNVAIHKDQTFLDLIKGAAVGQYVQLTIWRRDRVIDLELLLGEEAEHILYYQEGEAYRKKGEYGQAIVSFTKAIEFNPDFAPAYASRGRAYALGKKAYDLAIADCTKAIELGPKSAGAYNTRGRAWLNKRRLDQAIADFTEAITIAPKYGSSYVNRAIAYRARGDYQNSIADLNRIIEMYPSYGLPFEERGRTFERKGDNIRAKADYERAAKIYMGEGLKSVKKGGYAQAVYWYDKGIKLDTKYSPPLYYNRGLSNEKQGHHAQAISDYTTAISLNPEFSEAYLRRGFVYAVNLKQYEAARKDWETTARLDPQGDTGQAASENLRKLNQLQ